MQKIKAKLNSKRGVSLLLALLLFLLCALSGAAALTAAGSNIGRYSYMEEYQQEYLSVSSAAKLLKTQFEQGMSITVTCTDTNAVDTTGTMTSLPVYALLSNNMKVLLFDAYTMKKGGTPSGTIYSAPVEFMVHLEDEAFKDVNVKVSFKKPETNGSNADIKVELSLGEHRLEFTASLTFGFEGTEVKVATANVERITLPGS